jgi:hypothetical protein
MKTIWLSVGIFLWCFAQNILAQKTITCHMAKNLYGQPICVFYEETFGQNETVSIVTNPEDADFSAIVFIKFLDSSIQSVPSEIFTKFPSLEVFRASAQNIQEIRPETFWEGKKLHMIWLNDNRLTFLRKDTFKGGFSINFCLPKS